MSRVSMIRAHLWSWRTTAFPGAKVSTTSGCDGYRLSALARRFFVARQNKELKQGMATLPVFTGSSRRTRAAIVSFVSGVAPPRGAQYFVVTRWPRRYVRRTSVIALPCSHVVRSVRNSACPAKHPM